MPKIAGYLQKLGQGRIHSEDSPTALRESMAQLIH